MAKILLKDTLHPELKALGLKPGDTIEATADNYSKVGCMHFSVSRNGRSWDCSIWPQDYEIIENVT